jgi:predicted RNA binding protein YcfA (HicA-like mRNA interferase family)
MAQFPSTTGAKLLRVLKRKPLKYRVVRQSGSHRRLEADGRPPIGFSFHDQQEICGGVVRDILVDGVGLTPEEALGLL